MKIESLLDIFVPPEGAVGHSAALIAMTGAEDFLEDAMQRFTGLRPRQRAELGNVLVYLMLDGHASSTRKAVFPPGRIPGLHEFQPRAVDPNSLLHAKVALLAFAPTRTGPPTILRLAVLTANYTYQSARHQLELAWLVEVALEGTAPGEDRADVVAAATFVEALLARRFYRDEQTLAPKERRLTARLDALFTAASSLAVDCKPRFIHSLERPLYDQIRERFRGAIDKPRNFLLCGSGFYEEPTGSASKPKVFAKLEDLGVFTPKPFRVALVERDEAGAVADWAGSAAKDGWKITLPYDSLGRARRLHAKFVYVGYRRNGYTSNGWLYLGSGNLSRRGLLSHGGLHNGNVESGVVFEVAERFGTEQFEHWLFWTQDHAVRVDEEAWAAGQVGDAPDEHPILNAPQILCATIETKPTRHLRLLWREDATQTPLRISWTGADWVEVQQGHQVALKNEESPTALQVRDAEGHTWVVPVVDAAGRVGWKPPRFDSYTDALAALLDFPIRPAEATDDDDRDIGDDDGSMRLGAENGGEQEKNYALYTAAELVEKVAALQAVLPEAMLDDWIDHLDRIFRSSFPDALIASWRARRIDIFAHLREPELRPPHLTNKQRTRYFKVMDAAARAWWLQ